MYKLLVDTPQGTQEIIEVGEGGSYYDPSKVLWDERDGDMPNVTCGGLIRYSGALVVDTFKRTSQDSVRLDDLKQGKILAIDSRTQELIVQGFIFESTSFSLSSNAQMNWIRMYAGKTFLTFPMNVSTKNNNKHEILNEDDLSQFCLTAMNTVQSYIDSGNDLKEQVNDATSPSQLDAVFDSR